MIAHKISEWWRTALGAGREPSDDQIAAITAPHTGRRSVDAGAGTGKTSTLALRALYLIESERVRAEQIVVVTFTKKAAAEIGSRIADTIDRAIADGAEFRNDGRGVRCTTIHGLAADIRREFAFDLGFDAPPTAVSDGEAHGVFSGAFRALLDGSLDVDPSSFPLAEINLAHLERDLGKLALRLKNHGITPDTFEINALKETERFAMQEWGQLYTQGKKAGSRNDPKPKTKVTSDEIAREAEQERANVRVVAALLREFDSRLRERGAATYGDLIGETTASLRARPEIVSRLRERWRYVLLDESQDTSDLQLAFIETLFGRPGEADATGMMPVGDGRQAIYGFNGADEHVMQRLADVAEEPLSLLKNRRSFKEIVDIGHAVLVEAKIVDPEKPTLEAENGSGTLECVRLQNFGNAQQPLKERVKLEADAIAREIRKLLSDDTTQMSDIAILVRRRTHAGVYLRALNRQGVSAALDRRSGLFVADEIRDALAWMALLIDLRDKQAAVRVLQSELCGLSDATTIALAASKHWLERFLRDEPDDAPDVDGVMLSQDAQARLARVREYLIKLLPSTSLPLPAAMERLLQTLPIAASYVNLGKRENAETIGAQAIVNLASLEVLAREFAAENPGARLQDFVRDVDRRILYDDDVQEAELDLDGVRILTIHQAKGLEWPYVFVACSTKNQYANTEPSDRVVIYDRESGAFALKNDRDGRETFRWVCLERQHDVATGRRLDPQPRKEAADREQARVFYVALTRAKKRVYVTAPAPFSVDGKNVGEAAFLQSIRNWAQRQDASVNLGFSEDAASATSSESGGRADTSTFGSPHAVPRVAPAALEPASGFRPRISFTSISAFETCPRQARYRYRLHLPDLQEARPRFAGFDGNETPWATNAARLGSLVHRALEIWGRARIESERAVLGSVAVRLTYGEAFERARAEFADVTGADVTRARERGERAVKALAGYIVLAVEEPFEMTVGDTLVIGAVDLIARDRDGIVTVIDYKTGFASGDKYALQLALYRRVARARYAGERVAAVILRLVDDGAAFERAAPIADEEVERQVTAVGRLTNDEPRVGVWCGNCAYRGSPCLAPLLTSSTDTRAGVA